MQQNRRILRLPAVTAKAGIGRSTLYAMMDDGRFPRPIRLGRRAVGWPEDVVDAWIAEREAAST